MRSTRNWACCAADSLTWSALPSPATTLTRSPSSIIIIRTHTPLQLHMRLCSCMLVVSCACEGAPSARQSSLRTPSDLETTAVNIGVLQRARGVYKLFDRRIPSFSIQSPMPTHSHSVHPSTWCTLLLLQLGRHRRCEEISPILKRISQYHEHHRGNLRLCTREILLLHVYSNLVFDYYCKFTCDLYYCC